MFVHMFKFHFHEVSAVREHISNMEL